MSHRRNLFNGRYPLRFESEKLDLLPLLPEEIRIYILLHLSYVELRQCMFISKAWNKLVNSDYIWKKVCLTYGIEPDEDQKITYNPKPPLGLCKWAYIWSQFRGSPSFGWKRKIWYNTHLRRGHRFSLVVSDGKSIVRCFKSSLCLWKSLELNKRRLCIKLLPVKIDSKCRVAVDNDYIVITKCNILLIYKWTEYKYDFILALSTLNQARAIDHYLLKRFINQELQEGKDSLDILAFCKGCIWLKNKYKTTFILNLDTLKITKTLEFTKVYNIHRVTKWYIISWSSEHSRVRVDTFLGNNIFKIKQKYITDVLGNINILVVLSKRNRSISATTFDLGSGMPIVCWELCRSFDHSFELHPSKNIVYKIKFNRAETNRICALDALTGVQIWTILLENEYCHSSGTLKVICDQLLVFYNLHCICLQIYNADTGERMYDETRPEGECIHLSDNLIISKDEIKNVYNIRSFLTRPY